MMNATQAEALVERYLDAYNSLDVPGMLACLHPNVQFEHSTNGEVTVRLDGKAAFEAQATRVAAWFMERTQHITAFRWQNEQAEADIDYFAITATELPNGIKPGAVLNFSGHSRFSFRDELIAFIQDFS